MSCCGKAIRKARNVALGYARVVAHDAFRLPAGDLAVDRHRRLTRCRWCEHNTWLTVGEYVQHMGRELPKHGYGTGRKLCCRLCGCWLPAKAFVADERCPLSLWADDNKDPA